MADIASTPSLSPSANSIDSRPASNIRIDWLVILVSLWFLGGLFLDGWAHNNLDSSLESFFTPWHAVFYSGFLAVAGCHIWLMIKNKAQGYTWAMTLPQGYELSLAGMIIFALGGVGDLIWHELFGIEANVEALLSPTHLMLAGGIALIVAGPLRSTGRRLQSQSTFTWRTHFPMLLSLTLLLSMLTFMTQFGYIFTDSWLIAGRPGNGFDQFARQTVGVLSVFLQSAILMGVLLPIMRRWQLPPGTFTFILTLNITLMSIMRDEYLGIPAVVLTGLLSDFLWLWLAPSAQKPGKFRLFAFLLPFLLYSLFMLTVVLTAETWWAIHVLTGLPVIAGIIGLLLSYLVLPPPSLKPVA